MLTINSGRWSIWPIILLSLIAWTPLPAQTDENSADILVRNVTLIDPTGTAVDRTVNILVKSGRLDIITEDEISAREAQQTLDAEGGFVLGRMEIGQPPNFMILSDDPRENFSVLLDTRTFAVFAVNNGEVVRNRLPTVFEDKTGEKPVKSGWLAYTPPPLAVPLNYRDTSKWNRFDTKYVSGILVSGLVLDRMRWIDQDAGNRAMVGDLSEFNGGEIRGWRIGMVGTINTFEKPWVYTIFGATHAFDKGFDSDASDDFSFFDWRLDIPFFNNSTKSIGKQKEPISGERVQSMLFNHMQERSAPADALLPSRNVGVVWNGSSPQKYSSWAFGVFNDWFDASQDIDESATQLVGRVTWAPFRSQDDSNLWHVGAGYRYSNAKEGFRARTEPEFNQSPVYVDTGFGTESGMLPADALSTINLELGWRKGPLWLASEYFRLSVDNPDLGDPTFDGWWVGASWALTGEMRPYNRKNGTFGGLPISRSVYQNGKGAWEISTRFSHVDLEDGMVTGGKMDIASLGLSWWLTPFFVLDFNYRYIWNELGGEEGSSSGFNSRVVLMLE